MSIEKYRERVKELARQRIGEPIYNGTLDHAEIIVENMFAHARRQVSILSGRLNARVYGTHEVIEQVQLFLADGDRKIRILLEDNDQQGFKDHPFFDKFANHEDVEVKIVSPDLQKQYGYHFLIMDDDSYRFESDKDDHSAIAAFGHREAADLMSSIFVTLWEQSERLTLPQHENLPKTVT